MSSKIQAKGRERQSYRKGNTQQYNVTEWEGKRK